MFGSDHKGTVYACAHRELNAAIIYYGTSPNSAELVKLNVPLLGLHGGDDARVGATVEPASAEIKKL
jgi:carboxymethylenebutenolidase